MDLNLTIHEFSYLLCYCTIDLYAGRRQHYVLVQQLTRLSYSQMQGLMSVRATCEVNLNEYTQSNMYVQRYIFGHSLC